MVQAVTHRHAPAIPTKPVPPDPYALPRRDEAYCNWVTDVKTGAWKHRPAAAKPEAPAPAAPEPAAQKPAAPALAAKVDMPAIYKKYPTLKPLDGILHIENWDDPVVQANVRDLARYPAPVLAKLRKAGLKGVYIAAKPANQIGPAVEELGKAHPRGWEEGKSWDDATGAYLPQAKAVIIGKAQDGSAAVAVHETGHAIGALLGFDHDKRLIAHHDRLFLQGQPHPCYPQQLLPKLDEYLRQTDERGDRFAGRQEFFAESLAVYLAYGRQEAIKRYDVAYVKFLETAVLGAR